MTLSEKHRQEIEQSDPVVVLMPETGFKANPNQYAQVKHAMKMGKHIIIWRMPDRAHVGLPAEVETYADKLVVDGDHEAAALAVREYLELTPGTDLVVHHGGVDE